MRATSFGVPLNDNRSLSKISTPVKPAAAIASSFSASPPLSDTVAIEVCIMRLCAEWHDYRRLHCAIVAIPQVANKVSA